jgi:HEAT repeat protein
VVNDELAELLLKIVDNPAEDDEIRATAAISLGPALELGWEAADDWESASDVPISQDVYHKIQETVQRVYRDQNGPKIVRRRALEASVRSPEDWHQEAIRKAYASGDRDWKLTAVFAMREVRGFNKEILEALTSKDLEIHFEAVVAAGAAELKAAWPHIAGLLKDRKTPKELLLGAIEAAGMIGNDKLEEILTPFLDSDDEEIAEAAEDALSMAEEGAEFEDD